MFTVKLTVRAKIDIGQKETYESVAQLIRLFIDQNTKTLKKEHYESKFSYYTFSQFSPFEESGIYTKDSLYNLELKTIVDEFKDLKSYKGLETDRLELVAVSATKLYYNPKGHLISKTPVFLRTKKIEDEEYLRKVKEKIRENILFRYVKSGKNSNDDLEYLRKNVVEDIKVDFKVVTIPFKRKQISNDRYLIYHCINLSVDFADNEAAKEVEKLIYSSGLGMLTSNGFGYME
ncbi:hypothetical protein SOP94_17205 [Peribacillus frigoritolerans]|uniref:CRISPR-associated endoribonuclease Cas6 n=1 Tax=Peribacillus frigoritolerans TaxID=450367 RepID=UPI002B252B77|nr:CRISPR-associated endoribonuclease Cas6 [Peribacillus frigoritolerans]MEB2630196.1 hypothetical protein [Peribacillus frigoritolerans]